MASSKWQVASGKWQVAITGIKASALYSIADSGDLADLPGAPKGVKVSEEEVGCSNLKADQYKDVKKRTTCGIIAAVSECGLFLGVDELWGSESLTQVSLHFAYLLHA